MSIVHTSIYLSSCFSKTTVWFISFILNLHLLPKNILDFPEQRSKAALQQFTLAEMRKLSNDNEEGEMQPTTSARSKNEGGSPKGAAISPKKAPETKHEETSGATQREDEEEKPVKEAQDKILKPVQVPLKSRRSSITNRKLTFKKQVR